jgi:diacylglycerol kinase
MTMLRVWWRKFQHAFRGMRIGLEGQASFRVHLIMTLLVIGCGIGVSLPRSDWSVLVLCMTTVWCAEYFNTSMECLARAITRENHPDIAKALDIASGAVLVAALGAAIVGLFILLPRVAALLASWWGIASR